LGLGVDAAADREPVFLHLRGSVQRALGRVEHQKARVTKAEADLKPPPAKGAAAATAASSAATDAKMKAPIAWVPIDGSISIAEDMTGNTAKTAAVGEANKSLQSGDRDAAVKKLKVAGIEVAIVLAVMPIDMTIDKVHQAAVLIDAGKYYEGSQELRLAQANERFDMIGNMGTPKE
jgi:hypothetical protein